MAPRSESHFLTGPWAQVTAIELDALNLVPGYIPGDPLVAAFDCTDYATGRRYRIGAALSYRQNESDGPPAVTLRVVNDRRQDLYVLDHVTPRRWYIDAGLDARDRQGPTKPISYDTAAETDMIANLEWFHGMMIGGHVRVGRAAPQSTS